MEKEKRREEGEQRSSRMLPESLPFGAFVLGKEGKLLLRNRLSRRLYPRRGELVGFFHTHWDKIQGERAFTASFGEERVLVISRFCEEEEEPYYLVGIMEELLPLYRGMTKALLEEDEAFFAFRESGLFPSEEAAREESLRWERLRRKKAVFRHLIDPRFPKEEKSLCHLRGFFHSLEETLRIHQISLSLTCAEGVKVYCSPDALRYGVACILSCAVMNDCGISATVTAKKGMAELSFAFEGEENFISSLRGFAGLEEAGELSSGLSPLCYGILMSLKSYFSLEIREEEGKICVVLSLSTGTGVPQAFLATERAGDSVLFRQVLEGFLSLQVNGK